MAAAACSEGERRVRIKRLQKREAAAYPSIAGRTERRSSSSNSSSTKVRNAPLAVDPEGLWCCAPFPSPISVNTNNIKSLHRRSSQNSKPKQKPKPKANPPPVQPPESNLGPPQDESRPARMDSEAPPLRITVPSKMQTDEQIKIKMTRNGNNDNNNICCYKFNDPETSDARVSLSTSSSCSLNLNLHTEILINCSNLFAAKLSDQQKHNNSLPYSIEIVDCVDVEMYVETLRLMYSYCCSGGDLNLKRRLMGESVYRVLRILQASVAIAFEAGVLSCLEYLEAVPWTQEEEDKVLSSLMQLHHLKDDSNMQGAGQVLKRVLASGDSSKVNGSNQEEVLLHVLQLVMKANNEKARRELKSLVSKMLRETAAAQGYLNSSDLSTASLYHACRSCLDLLSHSFMQATRAQFMESSTTSSEDRGSIARQIARQADNLHWLLDILIDRGIADDFVCMWANQSELAAMHGEVPAMFRYEVSGVTARLCIGIGKGQMLACGSDIRVLLLQRWLQPLVDDFGWMQRACKSLDMKVVEEGICQTILTLPLKNQEAILINWLNHFLNNAHDCPNLQKAFEVWWRRAFIRPHFTHSHQNC